MSDIFTLEATVNWVAMIVVMLLISLLMIAGHYFPWRMLAGRELRKVEAYIYGVSAIAIPLTALFILEGNFLVAAALWLSILAGGAATGGCYLLDAILLARMRAKEAEEREAILKGKIE